MNSPPDKPPAHHPSIKDAAEGSGLYCFLDRDRECSAECMAFVSAPDGPDYKDQQWARCLLLVNAHRGGKHLVVLASTAGQMFQAAKNESADRARSQPGPPLPPSGRV